MDCLSNDPISLTLVFVFNQISQFRVQFLNANIRFQLHDASQNRNLEPDKLYLLQVDVKCVLPRQDVTDTNFHPNNTIGNGNQRPQISSTTHYSTSIKFYSDGTFYKEITGNPVSLKTGMNL